MDSLGNVGSRKRANVGNHYSAEEQALDAIAKEVCLIFTACIHLLCVLTQLMMLG